MVQDEQKSRILVVEDEAMICMLIEDMIQEVGGEVVGPAMTLEEASRLARDAAVDIAVMDINLGGRLTYAVADVLRDRGIPVVFATGYGGSGLPDRFRGSPILNKPFARQNLETALQAALGDERKVSEREETRGLGGRHGCE